MMGERGKQAKEASLAIAAENEITQIERCLFSAFNIVGKLCYSSSGEQEIEQGNNEKIEEPR